MQLSEIYLARYTRLAPIYENVKGVTEFQSDHFTSKMWILPNGMIKPLNEWHYLYILNNPDIAERFGIDIDSLPRRDEDTVRKAALKVGFFRVNYVARDQSMTIEGIKDKFNRHVKDAVFMLIFKNLKSIGSIQISMFDPTIDRVVLSKYVSHAASEEEKMQQLSDIIF